MMFDKSVKERIVIRDTVVDILEYRMNNPILGRVKFFYEARYLGHVVTSDGYKRGEALKSIKRKLLAKFTDSWHARRDRDLAAVAYSHGASSDIPRREYDADDRPKKTKGQLELFGEAS